MRTLRPSALLPLVLALPLTQNCAGPPVSPGPRSGSQCASSPGSHWLQFFETMVYGPDIWEPRCVYVSYVDNTQVQGFDSTAATVSVQPRAPWMEQEPPEYWHSQTEEALYQSQSDRKLFRAVMKYYGHSKDGEYHTLQKVYGCAVENNGNFLRGHYQLTYYGHDYIALNENLSSWTAEGKLAQILKSVWVEEAENMRTYLQEDCVKMLRRCLDLGKETLLRSDPPQTYVTRQVRPGGNVTLRCWALNFYPAEITLTWQKAGNNHTQDMEVIETRPAGDGTFQKWAALVVPSGEELRYTCHVNHEGFPEPLILTWEPPPPNIFLMAILTGLVLGALVMGTVVTFLIWKKQRVRHPPRLTSKAPDFSFHS
ncbi:hypothetical protein ACRRTK_022448 [Alexandromys fortis]